MGPEGVTGIISVTALSIAGLMVALVLWPRGGKPFGLRRNGGFFMVLCAMLALRAGSESNGAVWLQWIRAVTGLAVGIMYPWLLWRLYVDLGPAAGSEKAK
jgi:hypothetical protein